MIAEIIETTSTAAAAMSLTCFAVSCWPGEIRSVLNSREVFKSSAVRTEAMQNRTIHHSSGDNFRKKERKTARIVLKTWKRKLNWVLNATESPVSAQEMLFISLLMDLIILCIH